jgi:hypothetical protein
MGLKKMMRIGKELKKLRMRSGASVNSVIQYQISGDLSVV